MGCAWKRNEVTTPKFPPPPRMAQIEIAVFIGTRGNEPSVGQNQISGEQVVDGQPMLAGEVTQAASERQSTHAGGRYEASGHGETERMGRVVDSVPRATASHSHCSIVGIHAGVIDQREVQYRGGCTWHAVDHATHAFGLAVPTGFLSTTGVGGLTLGGGIGYLTPKHGLTIDNLLAADLVLADGRFVTASARENSDLFWAIRGGGGNFGVVTSFLFQAHPVHTDYAGPMLWPIERAAEVMRWYREFIATAPEDFIGFFAFLVVPPGPPFPEQFHLKNMCGIVWCYTGALEKAEETFKPIRSQLQPAVDLVGPIPHPVLQSMFDGLYPPGLQWYWKADFVNELSDEAIALHVVHGSKLPTMFSTTHLYPINGKAHQVAKADTAWSYREAVWAEVIVGVDPDPTNRELITTWARDYWNALHPYSAGGAYINFMMEEGEDRVKANYRENYERLASIKKKYDPTNLFRVNQNIKPA